MAQRYWRRRPILEGAVGKDATGVDTLFEVVRAMGDSSRKVLHGGDGSDGGEHRWEAGPVVVGGGRRDGEARGTQADEGQRRPVMMECSTK
jgi:hypothetical protein